MTKNKLGEAFGVIKQYDGNPKIENTLLTIYSGSGLLLERAIYNYKSGRMRYVNTSKKSLDIAENIKNKISCDGCPGNMSDGFEIEEVVVTGYPGRETVEPSPAEIPSGPGDFTGGGSGGGASTSGANISLATWQTIVLNKPFSLLADIPCDIIRNWLATAQRKLEKSQLDKLNTIKATPHIVPWLNEPIYARVQDINNAYSAVVNMDYFPIKINQLPTIGGNQLTPTQLLDYIRKNINTFVDTDRAEFTPYQYYGINDTELWNSSNPLNAVIGIDIGGHMPDNGSVIVSSYAGHMWTFTTIYDPKFQDHPVSGNRDFGFLMNADGSLSIYTRGVDRITNWDASWVQNSSLLQLLAGGSPLGEADALWGSFQQKVSDFVNKNGGKAQVEEAKTYRPDWELVKRVLEGRAPYFTFLATVNGECDILHDNIIVITMKGKIITNVVLAFIVLPILFLIQDFGNIVSGQYILYDAKYSTLESYLSKLLHETGYPLPSLIILIGILLPLEVVKSFALDRKKKYFFLKSTCCLFLIILCWLLIWLGPNVLLIVPLLTNIGLSIFINGFLYIFSDEKRGNNTTTDS